MALTARLYDSTFALAIHVRTQPSSLNEYDMSSDGSSHMVVVDGPPIELAADMESHSIRLQVPSSVQSLVSMTFDPQNPRCRLLTLFQSTGSSGLYATYPPSNVAMVSQEPSIMSNEYLLDGSAERERQRLLQLSFVDDNVSTTANNLQEELTALDRRFLQYLFRPAFPRGTGLALPPLAVHIRRALNLGPQKNDATKKSIELEVLRAVHTTPHPKTMFYGTPLKGMGATPKTPGTDMAQAGDMSFYDTPIVEPPVEEMRAMEVDDTDVVAALRTHENRWKTLLLEIWEQERAERLQLCMAVPDVILRDESAKGVVVRAGSMSVLQKQNDGVWRQSQPAILRIMDDAASKVMRALGEDTSHEEDSGETLAKIECSVWDLVCRGALGVEEGVLRNIQSSLSALAETEVLDALNPEERSRVRSALNISEDELVTLFRENPITNCIHGIPPLSQDPGENHVLSTQQRAAAASLVVRSVDSARQILLGRLLILLAFTQSDEATVQVLRMYLHCVAVLWTSAQRVRMRFLPSSNSSLKQLQLESTPPAKRQSLHENASSSSSSVLAVNGIWDRTTSIDSLLVALSETLPNELGNGSLSSLAKRLASHAAASLLPFGRLHRSHTAPPELAAIPPSSSTLTDEPKLAMRLVGVHMALPEDYVANLGSIRQNVFAECLLVASSSERGKKADKMVQTALGLLRFVPDDMPTSMKRVFTVCHHLRGQSPHGDRLTDFIENAIHVTPPSCTEETIQLWSSLFGASIALGRWDTAFEACLQTPDCDKRIDGLKRLVRSMVDGGALSELLELCTTAKSDVAWDDHVDSLQNSTGFYDIACETLAENSGRDMFSYLAVDPEQLSDYSGALYALQVSQGQWKMAAETLDTRYENARKALVDEAPSKELGPDALSRREALIVDDIVLALLGCVFALKQVPGVSSEFIAHESDRLASSLRSCRNVDGMTGSKRTRDSRSVAGGTELPYSPRFQTSGELSTRAIVSTALKRLYFDKMSIGATYALSMFANTSILSTDVMELVDYLFASGYYHDGLIAARALSKLRASKPNGRDVFAHALGHLLCNYLVPLATGQLIPEKNRPTLSQINAAFETMASPLVKPVVLELNTSGKKISELDGAAVRTGASALVQRLTVDYTTAECPVALEVADCMLDSGELPSWLDHLLVHGCGNSSDSGLFAKRPSAGASVYLGDPSALLSLYMKRGMYIDACRVVSSVLDASGRESKAPSRLPEKGDMDFVPYNKIDLLWNLIEVTLADGVLDKAQGDAIVEAREQMEQSLERHFELLNISEMGLKSARALR